MSDPRRRPSPRRSRPAITGLALTLALAALPIGPPASAEEGKDTVASEEDALELGRRDAKRFHDGELDALHATFGAEMKGALTLEALTGFRAQVESQLGAETQVLNESTLTAGGNFVYMRLSEFSNFDGNIQLVYSYAPSGAVTGFFVRPQQTEAETSHLDYKTKTTLRLPFEGEWYVFWGGRTIDQNYHTAYPDQRFAYDILMMKDGSSHTGDGTKNEQYHCFGQPVLAPGDGKVVSVANDVEDNVPGEMNPKQALGNHVIIDHGNGEFSFLAHFRMGTVTVAVDDEVKAGQKLGETGNSGNTSEAHIHFHLQTTAVFGGGEGLPAPFHDYMADGKKVELGEPVKGQVIQPN
jgi:hypothetical protein